MHTYPETSGKGKSACHFTLAEVYLVMGGSNNVNLTYEFFDETTLSNRTDIEGLLEKTRTRARGKQRGLRKRERKGRS